MTTRFTNASRHDRALAFGTIDSDTLAASGELAALIYDHAAEFIYDTDAYDLSVDETDDDLPSIYEDFIILDSNA